MKCHYCGHEEHIPNFVVRKCQGSRQIGLFWNRDAEGARRTARRKSPGMPALCEWTDTTRRKGRHEAILKEA